MTADLSSLSKIALAMICILALVASTLAALKPTDPDDPAFERHAFRFTDYLRSEMSQVLDKLLRPGMSETEIDALLIGAGSAEANYSHGGVKVYGWRLPVVYFPHGLPTVSRIYETTTEHIDVLFDDDRRLVAAASSTGWSGIDRNRVYQIQDEAAAVGMSPEVAKRIRDLKYPNGGAHAR